MHKTHELLARNNSICGITFFFFLLIYVPVLSLEREDFGSEGGAKHAHTKTVIFTSPFQVTSFVFLCKIFLYTHSHDIYKYMHVYVYIHTYVYICTL